MKTQSKKAIGKIYNGVIWTTIPVFVGIMLTISPFVSGESRWLRFLFFAAIAASYFFGIRAIVSGIRLLYKQDQEEAPPKDASVAEASNIRPVHTERLAESKINAVLPVIASDKTLFVVLDPAFHNTIETEDVQRYQHLLQSTGILRQQGYDTRFIRPVHGSSYSTNPLNKPAQIYFSDSAKFPNMWISPN